MLYVYEHKFYLTSSSDLISAGFISSKLSVLWLVVAMWTGLLHVAWPSLVFLWPVTVQMKWGQLRLG